MRKGLKRIEATVVDFPDVGKFPVSVEFLGWQSVLIFSIGRSCHYHGFLIELATKELELRRKKALVHLNNTMLLQFILDWCKLFGSTKDNEVHWRNLYLRRRSNDRDNKIRGKINEKIKNYIKLNSGIKNKYEAVEGALIDARNRYAAHLQPSDIPKLAMLNDAYRVACTYSSIVCCQDKVIMPEIADRLEFDREEIEVIISNG